MYKYITTIEREFRDNHGQCLVSFSKDLQSTYVTNQEGWYYQIEDKNEIIDLPMVIPLEMLEIMKRIKLHYDKYVTD